jgi:hypothetical protein
MTAPGPEAEVRGLLSVTILRVQGSHLQIDIAWQQASFVARAVSKRRPDHSIGVEETKSNEAPVTFLTAVCSLFDKNTLLGDGTAFVDSAPT